jgi:hypothetical protein
LGLLAVSTLAACGDAARLCDQALKCQWLRDPGDFWRNRPDSWRLDTCRELVGKRVRDTNACVACNAGRDCAQGPCDCLKGVINMSLIDDPLPDFKGGR